MNARAMTRLMEGLPNSVALINTATFNALIDHHLRTLYINLATTTITLPKANGSGTRLLFVVGLTATSIVISRAVSADVMAGVIYSYVSGTVSAFIPGATDNTFTLNGTTKGGLKGDTIELVDTATNFWAIRANLQNTGSAATPFSTV
jgi:hypothetical protein